jgi:methylated-DNA-[protein]-cysteine S-methyltransferase
MSPTPDEPGGLLRARGLRSTPQRRSILAVFQGGRTEHLSADEVYARASQSLPDLSRGTVYATLAEFTELGLLSAFGAPEPVRYETNTTRHVHFRCRVCLRLFDLEHAQPEPQQIADRGFHVERVEMVAEGVCADCGDYQSALTAAAEHIKRSGAPGDAALGARGVASIETESPLGPILLAATSHGLIRVAFEDHADARALRALASSRRGSHAARGHLSQASERLRLYFAGDTDPINCTIDWEQLSPEATMALQATARIPYATHRSYAGLGLDLSARRIGSIMGANPIPIVTPCHRVTRGIEIPTVFVGGARRREWLTRHEREHTPTRS